MRLIDYLECQDVILTWILTKLYNEGPPQTSWNYVLSMRHHHELPLTGVMELHPDHEAPPRNHREIMSWPMRRHHEISPRNSWNYILIMRHYNETFVELRPDHTKIMSHQPSMKFSCISISFQYIINHLTTFHTYIMSNSSISAHTIRYYMHIHILHTLNRVIQTKLTINNQKHGKEQPWSKFMHQSRSSQGPSLRRKRSFAQATGPRLDETTNRESCKIREFSLGRVLLA